MIEGGGRMAGSGQVVDGGSGGGMSGGGGSFEVQFSGGGGGGQSGILKSQSSTQKKTFASTSSSSVSGGTKGSTVVRLGGIGMAEDGFHDASDYSSMKGGDGKMGVKTVIKESYGANNIKTIVTEEIEIATGKVISSKTTQAHYDSLPTFQSSSSSSSSTRGFAKSAFNFAKSGITAEK